MTEEKATVDLLIDAKTGDKVWMFDGNANKYVNGAYMGRGAWKLCEIDNENRASFIVGHGKFDRKTGFVRATGGYLPMQSLYGQKEYEGQKWRDDNLYKLSQFIEHNVTNIDVLKQIAALVGYVEK